MVATPIESEELRRGEQASLFVAGRLSQYFSATGEGAFNAPYGFLDDVGFASRWADPLSSLPPRNMVFCRDFMEDRFFWVRSGDCGPCLASVEINEHLVEDYQMRGPVDYTGFQVILGCGADVYAVLTKLVGIDGSRAFGDYLHFVFCIPTPPFAFPAQRGRPTDLYARIKSVKDLQPIKRLEVSDMIVAIVNRRTLARSDGAPILDRYEILSAMRLVLVSG
ncbi:hypothetical protein XH79_00040 [Bradyrhizobium sp. CCBAU 45389]|nr:hypothetical protein [Bradyrhizobium sp. CCBAU 45389]